jgi:chromate reductase, NAD(P)H dehydrogenase (quinone)
MTTIISGTNRDQAVSLQIASLYQQLLTERGAPNQLLDLGMLPHDFAFSALYGQSGKNASFNQFDQAMRDSDRYVFIIPEYNGSFPGVLKTFIDGLPYPNPMKDKVAALVGLSSGMQGGALALSHFNDILHYLGVETLSLRVKLAAIGKNFQNGQITNQLYSQLLNTQADKLLAFPLVGATV